MIKGRYSIITKNEIDISPDQCDLCDREILPLVSWGTIHDDPYGGTKVCLDCLKTILKENVKE